MSSDTSCFLIALSGGSGSGKSTLATALIARLGPGRSVLVREDDYYRSMSDYGAVDTPAQRAAIIAGLNYDSPDSKESSRLLSDLSALKSGQRVNGPRYDYAVHDRSALSRRLEPAPVIILEGIHALSLPELADIIDLSVYVDTPDDLRLARRIRRDVVERKRDVEDVLSQYLTTVRAAHYQYTYPAKFVADLVIADEGLPAYGDVTPPADAIERMLAPVLERLSRRGLLAR